MEVGVGLPSTIGGTDGRLLVDYAARAERLGFSTLAVFDRLVYDNYDSIVALSAAAGVTERIRLATTVLLAPYRPSTVLLAKQLASLDRISGGRLVVGVAAGGRDDDFAASGTCYTDRGRRLDAMLPQLREVWSGAGQWAKVGPKPVHGDIPIWVGGHSPAALRRAARHGVGWVSPGGSTAGYPQLVERAREVFAASGRAQPPRMVALANVALADRPAAGERSRAYIESYYAHVGPKAKLLAQTVITDRDRLRATVTGYAEAGCDELLLFPCIADPEQLDLIAGELAALGVQSAATR
ncbi:MAG TPA: LLM class flavin-dependent oxidoreductase [Jatrophihabitans sp.]|nr:LLM class flavin-dependent oxidoreductase [Jatrophihabitans sp.]